MKCPKCQYISFDDGDKCRNCDYQFALSAASDDLDLPIERSVLEPGRTDLSLEDLDGPFLSTPDRLIDQRPITDSFDLPLFRDADPRDNRPLAGVPAITGAPLSVRKGSIGATRQPARRHDPHEPSFDLEPQHPEGDTFERPRSPRPDTQAPGTALTPAAEAASVGTRILSGLVDLILLSAIDAAVLHFTLKSCGLSYAEIRVLPIPPFAAFLLILNGGYLAAFTAAGGQSIGKMLGGIRVVPSDPEAGRDRVPLGQAVLRAAGYFISALPFGLGFLPAVIAPDRRGFHDRLAHTRVVKA